MSIIGILSSNLFSASAGQNTQNTQGTRANAPRFEQIKEEFQQLGQDLQSGNLQAAQKDFTNLQQTAQQNIGQQIQGHHRHGHRHYGGGTEFASSSSSQQSNPISQAFSTLGQDLQAGNLSGAQAAFATLQNDLQQIGGFVSSGSSSTGGTASPSSTAVSASAGSLNVTA